MHGTINYGQLLIRNNAIVLHTQSVQSYRTEPGRVSPQQVDLCDGLFLKVIFQALVVEPGQLHIRKGS